MKQNRLFMNSTSSVALVIMINALMPARETIATQLPLDLGSASTFGVLAGSTVTSTGSTIVYGDLGISPGTSLVGFPPGIVNGATHLYDGTATQAKTDLALAYIDATSRTNQAILIAAEIGGTVLTQGLYKATTTLSITTGDLTLDGLDDPNAVWIFQTGTTLGMAANRTIHLINGARAENIFWAVGSSATIGANVTFRGTILADQAITLGANVIVDGRMLAIAAAVTLDATTFHVANSVELASSTLVAGPYITTPEQSLSLSNQTITVNATNPTCFYLLRSSTSLTITGINVVSNNVSITYAY
jgi:Ice-binding-like